MTNIFKGCAEQIEKEFEGGVVGFLEKLIEVNTGRGFIDKEKFTKSCEEYKSKVCGSAFDNFPLFDDEQINQEVQLPSDYLLENHKTLERLNDFDEMREELDALQHEAMQYAFQDGVTIGEVKVLRQFVNGQLDKEFVQDFLEDYDREIEDNTFRIGDSVCTKEMEDCGVITGVSGYKFIVTWAYGSDAECKTELFASDLIKC